MCHQAHLQVLLDEVKDLEAKFDRINFLHLVRKYNGAADLLATEALKTQENRVVSDEPTTVMLKKLNKLPDAVYIPTDVEETTLSPVESEDTDQRVVCAAVDHPDLDDDDMSDTDLDELELDHLERQLSVVHTDVVVLGEVSRLLAQCYPDDDPPPRICIAMQNNDESDSDTGDEGIEIVAIDESLRSDERDAPASPEEEHR